MVRGSIYSSAWSSEHWMMITVLSLYLLTLDICSPFTLASRRDAFFILVSRPSRGKTEYASWLVIWSLEKSVRE